MRPLPVLILVFLAIVATVAAIFLTRGSDQKGGPVAVTPNGGAAVERTVETGGEVSAPAQPRVDVPVTPDEAPRVAATDDEDGGPATNRVVGVVYNDQNQPVAEATVKMSMDALMGEDLALDWFANRESTGKVLHTRTNAKGEYTFRGVDPGRNYHVMASHTDYAAVQESDLRVTRSGEVRVPDLVLRAGSICRGSVVDSDGTPIADAEIAIDSAYMMSFEMESPDRLTAKSDGNGFFEFKNVSPGARIISCWADGFERQIHHDLNFTGQAGEVVEKNFTLGLGHPLAGRVFGPQNEGVFQAKVIAMNYGSNTSSRGDTLTDEDGNFQIDGLAEGSYMVMVQAKGYRMAHQNRVRVGDLNVQLEMIKQNTLDGRVFDLASGKGISTFTVQLLRVNSAVPIQGTAQVSYEPTDIKERISGAEGGAFTLVGVDPGIYAIKANTAGYASRVTDHFTVVDNQPMPPIEIGLSKGGSIKGRIVDAATSQPIAGVRVSSKDGDLPSSMTADPFLENMIATRATERRVSTDSDGFFELKLLNPGRYRLLLEHPSFTSEWVENIAVVEGQTGDAGSISLRGGGTVRGKVLDGSGKPATRAVVRMFADNDQFEARTDAEGRFEIAHVKPGLYRMSATTSPGAAGDPFDALIQTANSEIQVQVIEGQTVNRDLQLGN